MAIAFDATAPLNHASPGPTTNTTSFNVISNTKGILLLACFVGANAMISAATYAGFSLTPIDDKSHGVRVSLWQLLTPPTGANNVVTTSNGGFNYDGGVASYTGVDQSTPIDASTSDTTAVAGGGGDAPYTINPAITVNTNNAWLVMAVEGAAYGAAGDSTVRVTSQGRLCDKGPVSTGSNTIGTTTNYSGGASMVSITVALKPDGSSTLIKTINGLAKASVKTRDGLAIASMKTFNGLV